MALPDYVEFLDPLELPIRGKTYVIQPMSFEDGLRISPLLEGGKVEGLTDEEVESIVLGPAAAEMHADKVTADAIFRAYLTALAEYQYGRAVAEIMWKTGGDPKAIEDLTPKPNRATRRKASKQSPRTGAANTTK